MIKKLLFALLILVGTYAQAQDEPAIGTQELYGYAYIKHEPSGEAQAKVKFYREPGSSQSTVAITNYTYYEGNVIVSVYVNEIRVASKKVYLKPYSTIVYNNMFEYKRKIDRLQVDILQWW